MKKPYELLLCGVGGQGILTVSDIISEATNSLGLQIRGAETHGMAQRGGSVVSYLRIAEKDVYAPLISERSADAILSFEPVEALRYAKYIQPNGYILSNTYPIIPPSVTVSKVPYPDFKDVQANILEFTPNFLVIDATPIAKRLGAAVAQNIVMLGALSAVPGFPIPENILIATLRGAVKEKFIDLNISAFKEGQQCARALLG